MRHKGITPLLDAIILNDDKKITPFHMPGHKKGKGVSEKFSKAFKERNFSLDLTEIPGLDDLHKASSVIKQAQEQAAKLFGADKTFFLVNGTTVGIHSAIMSVCRDGDKIIMPRDVHRSVLGGCILSGAHPVYLSTVIDPEFIIPYPPSPTEIEEAIKNNPTVKAVFLTYPSYYGISANIKQIVQLVHNKGIPLIVDEAHGAHFKFSSKLPVSALEAGADISIQSTHKTLGALTQASMLHVKSSLVNAEEVSMYLRLLQSTSPSYLLMASLDATTEHLTNFGEELIEKTLDTAFMVRDEIDKIPGLKCLNTEISGRNEIYSCDPTKLYISSRDIGLTGYELEEILLHDYKIQVELSDRYSVLCMLTFGNTNSDAVKLVEALQDISNKREKQQFEKLEYRITDNILPAPKVVISPRKAWLAKRKKVLLKSAIGGISCEMVAPYPPGIPIVCPGEEITSEVLSAIDFFKSCGHSFHGPKDSELKYIEVCN